MRNKRKLDRIGEIRTVTTVSPVYKAKGKDYQSNQNNCSHALTHMLCSGDEISLETTTSLLVAVQSGVQVYSVSTDSSDVPSIETSVGGTTFVSKTS